MHKEIIFINSPSFPFGEASTNRILTLATGLVKNDVACKVVSVGTFKLTGSNYKPQRKGIYKGVKFIHFTPFLYTPKFKMLRKINTFIGIIFSIPYLVVNHNRNNTLAFISSQLDLFSILIFKLISIVSGVKYVLLRSEYPNLINRKVKYASLYMKYILKPLYSFYNGAIFMTFILQNYFNNLSTKKKSTIVIPLTIEIDKFNCSNYNKNNKMDDLIVYCGSMNDSKEGISNLLDCIHKASLVNPKLKLTLYGELKDDWGLKYEEIIAQKGISEFVSLKGLIHSNEIPYRLCEAKLLIMIRPKTKLAEGGFPTKLGEYLSTGIPVLCTNTGEISHYLTNEVDAYILESDAPDIVANAITKIFENYENALRVGYNGKLIASNNFAHDINSKKLIEYLKAL